MTATSSRAARAETGFLVVAAPAPRRRRRRDADRDAGSDSGGGGAAGRLGRLAGRAERPRPRGARRALGGRLAVAPEAGTPRALTRWCPGHQVNAGSLAMRIAQVAPLAESVPPPGYGGTERVVSYLTEELVREGHEVTLFASGDSQTARRAGRLRAAQPAARRGRHRSDRPPGRAAGGGRGRGASVRHRPLARRLLPLPDVAAPRRAERDDAPRPARHPRPPARCTTSSARCRSSRSRTTSARRCRRRTGRRRSTTACRSTSSRPHSEPGEYLAFLGASRRRSGPTGRSRSRAAPGMPLRIAAKVDDVDREYFETRDRAAPRAGPRRTSSARSVRSEKNEFLGNARALALPDRLDASRSGWR